MHIIIIHSCVECGESVSIAAACTESRITVEREATVPVAASHAVTDRIKDHSGARGNRPRSRSRYRPPGSVGGPISVAAHTFTDGTKYHKLVLVARNQADRLRQQTTKLGVYHYSSVRCFNQLRK
jgi:hypothetical protein